MAALWLAKWPNGEVVLTRADDEDEVRTMLDEADDPGEAKVEEYEGPLALVLTPKLPGRQVGRAEYCRPKGPPPPADALRRGLWEQQQQGRMCDARVKADDGATRQAHRAVLCAACPALERALGGARAPRSAVALPDVPTGPLLDALLRWLYLSEADFEHAEPEEVLQVAQQLELQDLAAECDYALALRLGHQFRYDEPRADGLKLVLKTLQFADQHARLRLLRCALATLPGDCWRELKALPAFKQLAQPLAASALAAASRDPVWVRREIGFRRVSVRAEAYREAGGRLTRQEQAEVRAHQRVRAQVAQQAAGAGGDGDGDGAVALTYEVTREDLEAAGMHGEGASMQWQLGQPANTEYEAGIEMWEAVGRFACPHLAAEIERQRDAMGCDDWDDDEQVAELDARLQQAVAREAGGGDPDPEALRRWAQLVVRAERGEPQAQLMLAMDVSVAGVFPGL